MNLDEATRRATRAVLGTHLDDFQAARAAFQAGALSQEQYAPLKRDFDNALERRRDTIAHEVRQLLRGAVVHPCCEKGCTATATTTIAGRRYCDAHAVDAPRLPVPAGMAS